MLIRIIIFTLLSLVLLSCNTISNQVIDLQAKTYYISTTGKDTNPGTFALPFKTFAHAIATVIPGDRVLVRGGTYTKKVDFDVSGSENNYITFQNYPGERVILDGGNYTGTNADWAFFSIYNQNWLKIIGFEFLNYKTNLKNKTPIAIAIEGTSHHIQLLNNKIHDMGTTYPGSDGGNAHAILVEGIPGPSPVNNIIIKGNTLYNLTLGFSEALSINGNVTKWEVTNNTIYNANNIGIDAIGYENGSLSETNRARNGLIAGNRVFNVDTKSNPAYEGDRAAACIYVDGGTSIIIERNTVFQCNIGIEIASETPGKATSNVTVRNNFVYRNHLVGIGLGGSSPTDDGGSTNNRIINNTLFANSTDSSKGWGGSLLFQFNVRNNIVRNNIFYAQRAGNTTNTGELLIQNENASSTNSNNSINNNIYFGPVNGVKFRWKNVLYTSFATYKAASRNDANSRLTNPLLVNSTLGSSNLHLQSTSPAINTGINLSADIVGTLDIDGQTRKQGLAIDIGAEEVR